MPTKKSDPCATTTIHSNGDTLQLNDDDITVHFPEGFIMPSSIPFTYRVIPHELFGQESFPQGARPVSAILLLHPCENVQFLKPIEVTMPHFIDLETEDDCKRLTFFKACVDNFEIVNSQKVKFEEVSDDMIVSLFTSHCSKKVQYAKLYATHCCYICVGEVTREDTNKARFCLTQAQRTVSSDSRELSLHFCIHYSLPTCLKVMVKSS